MEDLTDLVEESQKEEKSKPAVVSTLESISRYIPIKLIFIILLAYVMVNLDIWNTKILSHVPGAYEEGGLTNKGIAVNAAVITLLFILANFLIEVGVF